VCILSKFLFFWMNLWILSIDDGLRILIEIVVLPQDKHTLMGLSCLEMADG
jgi:hypothetical protein